MANESRSVLTPAPRQRKSTEPLPAAQAPPLQVARAPSRCLRHKPATACGKSTCRCLRHKPRHCKWLEHRAAACGKSPATACGTSTEPLPAAQAPPLHVAKAPCRCLRPPPRASEKKAGFSARFSRYDNTLFFIRQGVGNHIIAQLGTKRTMTASSDNNILLAIHFIGHWRCLAASR